MSTLLITGGGGFVGAHVARAALAAGHAVGIIALPTEPLARIADLLDRVRVFRCDIEDVSSVHGLVDTFKPQCCIHLAWCVRPGKWQADPRNVAMLSASLDLLEVLADTGCSHVVTAGSCAEYATSDAMLTEQSHESPDTLYGACKLSLRHVGGRIAALRSMTLAHARIFSIYGPGEHASRLVPAAAAAMLAGQPFVASADRQVRDYLHVADVASGLLTLCERQAEGVFNICSGQPVSARQLLAAIARMLSAEHLLSFDAGPAGLWDPPRAVGDNSRLRSLGWQPTHTLVSGLSDTIDWWQSAGRRPAAEAAPAH